MPNDQIYKTFIDDRNRAHQTTDTASITERAERLRNRSKETPEVSPIDPTAAKSDGSFFTVRNFREFSDNVSQIPRGMAYGAINAAQETVNSAYSLVEWATGSDFQEIQIPNVSEPDSTGGQLAAGITQFVAGFIPTFKALKFMDGLGRFGKLARIEGAGMIVDAFMFDPYEERLSNLINEYPGLRNPVTEFLATDPNDGEAINRFRASIEGAVAGQVLDGFVRTVRFVRNIDWMKHSKMGDLAPKSTVNLERSEPSNSDYMYIEGVDRDFVVPLVEGTPQEAMERLSILTDEYSTIGIGIDFESSGLTPRFGKGFNDMDRRLELVDNEGNVVESIKIRRGDFATDFIKLPNGDTIRVGPVHGGTVDAQFQVAVYGPDEQLKETLISGEDGQASTREEMYGEVKSYLDKNKIKYRDPTKSADIESFRSPSYGPRTLENRVIFTKDDSSLIRTLNETEVTPEGVVRFLEDIANEAYEGGFVNINRIRSDEDLDKIFATMEDHYGGDPKWSKFNEVETWDEAAKLADELDIDLKEYVGANPEDIGSFRNAADAAAKRAIVAQSGENLARIANRIRAGDDSTETIYQFVKSIQIHDAIQQRVKAQTTETARSLNILKREASAKDTNDFMEEIITEFADSFKVQGMTSHRKLKQIAEMVSNLDSNKSVNNFLHNYRKASGIDMLYEIWMNALLSGPRTHMVNIASNAMTNFWAVPERLLAAGISDLMGTKDGVVYKEVGYQLFGMGKGFLKGLRAGAEFLRTGEVSDPLTKIENIHGTSLNYEALSEIPTMRAIQAGWRMATPEAFRNWGPYNMATYLLSRMIKGAVDSTGYVMRLPSTMLQFEDIVFKNMAQGRELHAMAIREATHAAEEQGYSDAARIYANMINNPDKEVLQKAIDEGRISTFTNELGAFGRGLQQAMDNAKIAGLPIGRLLLPFIRTPLNIAKFGLERTIIGAFMKRNREAILRGGADADIAMAKMAFGSMVMLGVMDAVFSGFVTGAAPKDPGVRDAFKRTGRQAYSIHVNGTNYSFNRLEPMGMIMGIAADLAQFGEYMEEADVAAIGSALVHAISANIGDKTFMTGITAFSEAYSDPERYLEAFLQSMGGTVVPTGVAQAERAFMPALSAINTVMDRIKSRVPGWSDEIPPRRNLWGETIYLPGGVFSEMITPVYNVDQIWSPIDEEILRMRMDLRMPSKRFESVELTPEQYDDYVLASAGTHPDLDMGTTLKEVLDQMVTDPGWQDLPDEFKKEEIREMVSNYRSVAKNFMIDRYPDLVDKIQALKEEQYKVGVGETAIPSDSPTRIAR